MRVIKADVNTPTPTTDTCEKWYYPNKVVIIDNELWLCKLSLEEAVRSMYEDSSNFSTLCKYKITFKNSKLKNKNQTS